MDLLRFAKFFQLFYLVLIATALITLFFLLLLQKKERKKKSPVSITAVIPAVILFSYGATVVPGI
jgi:hypothetical protein